MAEDTHLQVRVSSDLKGRANLAARAQGTTLSWAIKAFLDHFATGSITAEELAIPSDDWVPIWEVEWDDQPPTGSSETVAQPGAEGEQGNYPVYQLSDDEILRIREILAERDSMRVEEVR